MLNIRLQPADSWLGLALDLPYRDKSGIDCRIELMVTRQISFTLVAKERESEKNYVRYLHVKSLKLQLKIEGSSYCSF